MSLSELGIPLWVLLVSLPWLVGGLVALRGGSSPEGLRLRGVGWVAIALGSALEVLLLLAGVLLTWLGPFPLPDPMPDEPWVGPNDFIGPAVMVLGWLLGAGLRSLGLLLVTLGFGRVLRADRQRLQGSYSAPPTSEPIA